MRSPRLPALCALLLLAAGCYRPAPPVTRAPAPPTASSHSAGLPTPANRVVTRGAAGGVKLGMTAAEVKALPNRSVSPIAMRLEGEPAPALIVRQFGINQALVELKDGRAWRVRVLTDQYRTPEGAHVGMKLTDLEAVYGKGRILSGEGNTLAAFDRAPGMSFLFDRITTRKLPAQPSWAEVRKVNPRVVAILLTGTG